MPACVLSQPRCRDIVRTAELVAAVALLVAPILMHVAAALTRRAQVLADCLCVEMRPLRGAVVSALRVMRVGSVQACQAVTLARRHRAIMTHVSLALAEGVILAILPRRKMPMLIIRTLVGVAIPVTGISLRHRGVAHARQQRAHPAQHQCLRK